MVEIRISTQNLWWKASVGQRERDVATGRNRSDIVLYQEAYHQVNIGKVLGDDWGLFRNKGEGWGDVCVAWRKSKLEGLEMSGPIMGHQQGGKHTGKTYRAPNVRFRVRDDNKQFTAASIHFPYGLSRRADPNIWGDVTSNLAEWWRRQQTDVIVGGDWNWPLRDNPAGLAGKLPAVWKGSGGNYRGKKAAIDGFLVTRGLAFDNVKFLNAGVNSDHPIVTGVLQSTSIGTGTGSGGGDGGDGTEPEEPKPDKDKPEPGDDPDTPPPPPQGYEPDRDSDYDHSECCGRINQ